MKIQHSYEKIKLKIGLMLKSMKRNYSKEADNIMDWIELGCFDALEKKYVTQMKKEKKKEKDKRKKKKKRKKEKEKKEKEKETKKL